MAIGHGRGSLPWVVAVGRVRGPWPWAVAVDRGRGLWPWGVVAGSSRGPGPEPWPWAELWPTPINSQRGLDEFKSVQEEEGPVRLGQICGNSLATSRLIT